MKNRRIVLLLVFLLGSFLALIPAAAQEEPEDTPEAEATEEMMGADDTSTYVRFAHFAPGVDGVDAFIDDTVIDETNLTYPGVSGWIPVQAGSYNFDVSPTGDTADNAVVSADDVEIGPGFVTVLVAQGQDDQPTAFVIRENRDDLLPATSGLTLMNGLGTDTPVNIDRNDIPFATELGAPGNRALYTPVDSGTYTFRAYNPFADGDGTLGEATEVELMDGSFYLIAAVGTEDDAQLVVHETTGAEFAMIRGNLEEPGTIVEAIQSRETLTGYGDIINSAGISETLSAEGPYTVFLPADYLTDEINSAAGDDTDMLATILENHVVEGNIPMGQLTDTDSVTTLAGNTYDVTIEGNTVLVGGMEVLTANVYATNGVIHIIDGILSPPESGQ